MGADLAERLRRAGLESTGQRRNVTVLFADISGYTSLSTKIDGEDLYNMVQDYVRILSSNVYKYEGVVDKISGDGLMALFGAPISHENNAERAVRAAMDMQTELQQFSSQFQAEVGHAINVRIGLHSGVVIVGGIGVDLMMNYTAIGDTVNLAHRIEEAAPPGSILISESVYRQVRAFFDCTQISVLNLKGIAQPVTAYRVVGQRLRPGSPRGVEGLQAPMIGRDQELIVLKQSAAEVLAQGKGQLVIITGDAGLGKSRLTLEFKASLEPGQFQILEGQSLAYRRMSYWLIREMLYSYLGLSSSTPVLQVRERLSRNLYLLAGDRAADLQPYLEHLLSLPYSDPGTADRLRQLDARQLRQQIFLAVRDLLNLEAFSRPLLLVLDDLHWADEASLELLLYILDVLPQAPIMILGISRSILPGTLEKIPRKAAQLLDGHYRHIPLQLLSLDQSKQLLHLLLSIPDLPEKLREHIVMRAAGIPFYLEEILRMLIDEGILLNEYGRWRVIPGADVASLGVPGSLQELILARFDRLQPAQRHTLQVASVIGKNFSLPILGSVLRTVETLDLHRVVDQLVERDFILPQAGTNETEFTFRHVLMSDAIYATILRKERSQMHGQVGDVIETIFADRLDDQVELLANHYRWSPKREKALHYLILAGQKAARNHVNEQARQNFEAALEILPQAAHSPYQVMQVYMGLGDALSFFGEYLQAREHYQAALDAIASDEPERYAEENSMLQRRLARTFERQGEYDQAVVHLEVARGLLEDRSQRFPDEMAQVWQDIGWIWFRRGSFSEAQECYENALRLVENTDSKDVIASVYNRLGGVAYNQGDWQGAVRYLRKSINLREAIGDVVGLASSSNNLGCLEVEMGMLDNALEDLTRNYELVKRLGQVEGVAVAYNNLGWLSILRGEPDEAHRALQTALEMASQIGFSSLHHEALKNVAELYLETGEWDRAIQVLIEVKQSFDELGATDQLLNAYRMLSEAFLEKGELAEAQTWLCQAEELLQTLNQDGQAPPALQQGELLCLRGAIATATADYATAAVALGESRHIFERMSSALYLGKVTYYSGRLAAAQGDASQARQLFREAQSIFERIGAKLEARRAALAVQL